MRARAYSLILLVVFSLAMVGWIVSANGLVDRNGKPIGTDFSSFYAADGIRDVHLGRSPYAATIIRDSEGRAGLLWEGIV